jgi:hypothetical protein
MNKLVAFLALTSALSIFPDSSKIDYEALKKSNEENKRQVIQELNDSVINCLKTAEKHSAFIIGYADAVRQKNPNYDLHQDKLFASLLDQYHRAHQACHQKISAMAQLKAIALAEFFVQR